MALGSPQFVGAEPPERPPCSLAWLVVVQRRFHLLDGCSVDELWVAVHASAHEDYICLLKSFLRLGLGEIFETSFAERKVGVRLKHDYCADLRVIFGPSEAIRVNALGLRLLRRTRDDASAVDDLFPIHVP